MKVGDLAMIYHSVGPREIVGIARVTKGAFDEATNDKGDWVAVEVEFSEELKQTISLQTLKQDASLQDLSLIKQSRLSVCPVTKEQWLKILRHAQA
jgi:predicted RNA-binding protein with PUA-like domain